MDWTIIFVGAVSGALAVVPTSYLKSLAPVSKLLEALPWPWAGKIALAITTTGGAGLAGQSFTDGNAQIGFLAAALAGTILYQLLDRLGLEGLIRDAAK